MSADTQRPKLTDAAMMHPNNTSRPGAAFSATGLLDDDESQCGKPCSPDNPCDECAGYWQRMVAEGYWNRERHRWTEKGWAQITRVI